MAKGKGKIAREGLNGSATHLLHRALQLALDYHAEAPGRRPSPNGSSGARGRARPKA